MGFIEDTGAAQYFRDSRILPIYEGTNGIQALDLLRRKLFQENGKTFKNVIQIIEKTITECKVIDNVEMISICNLLKKSLKVLEDCGLWLTQSYIENPEKAAAGATPFISMFGWILGGWVMVNSAYKCNLILSKKTNDKFSKEKINTAIFYCKTYLPIAVSLESTIKNSYPPLENFA